jgi:uncharacterized protein YaaQ
MLPVSDTLVEAGFRVTRIASTGGFLRHGNVTLLIGVEEEEIQRVCDIIEENCEAPEPGRHKATLFILPAEDFVRLG